MPGQWTGPEGSWSPPPEWPGSFLTTAAVPLPVAPPILPAAPVRPGEASWLAAWRGGRWPLVGGLLGLFCDLLTKDLAAMLLPGRAPLQLTWGVQLVHRVNQGLLFGLGGALDPLWRRPLVAVLPLLALLFVPPLVAWLVRAPRLRAWAVALISAGALGNLLERLWRAEVVDFLQFGPPGWTLPAFNLADFEILTGTLLVLIAVVRAPRPSRVPHPHPEEV